jgi:ABC-type branched-subunit amino acid transport system substrate-binding protein
MRAGVIKRLNEENCDPFWRNQGTRFELITRDDGYIPAAAAENTRKLIEDDGVIALVGNLGTPTAERAWKIANDAGVLFYAAYTGTDILRQKPPAPFVVNYRASDHQAMNLIVTHIIAQGIPVKQIGVFLQDDAFGNGGLAAAHATLGKICGDCAQAILTMRYERNTLKVDEALRIFIEASPKPKAVILVGTTEPCAEFIRFVHRLAPTTRFYSLSSGRAKLAQLLPDIDDKIYFTQVTPPTSSNHNTLDNEDALEGYLSTSFLMDAMRPISENISSTSVRNSLISLEQKLAPEDRRGQHTNDQQLMDDVWLVPMKDVAQHPGTGE